MRNFRERFFPVSRETPHGPGPIGRRHRERIIRFEGIMWKMPRPSWDGRGASRDIKKIWPESLFPPPTPRARFSGGHPSKDAERTQPNNPRL
jgi:hypothetical protein